MSIEVSEWVSAPAKAPRSIFAIGDVHGMADLLDELHQALADIANKDGLDNPLLVHLGDYIDRGPDSLRVLDIASAGAGEMFEHRHLMGNHEQMLLTGLYGPESLREEAFATWLLNGGIVIVTESGAEVSPDPAEFSNTILSVLGEERVAFLRGLESHVRCGDYLFVHAGIPPEMPLAETFGPGWDRLPKGNGDEYYSPLWIRYGFLDHDGPLPDNVIAVHGHTIRRKPEIREHRIGIDTGAYRGGCLTAAEFRDDQMRFIHARADE